MIEEKTERVIDKIKNRLGSFITHEKDLDAIIKENRLEPVLVRCGSGRFTCPAQDVRHFINIIRESERDYVRDISLINPLNSVELRSV